MYVDLYLMEHETTWWVCTIKSSAPNRERDLRLLYSVSSHYDDEPMRVKTNRSCACSRAMDRSWSVYSWHISIGITTKNSLGVTGRFNYLRQLNSSFWNHLFHDVSYDASSPARTQSSSSSSRSGLLNFTPTYIVFLQELFNLFRPCSVFLLMAQFTQFPLKFL